MSYSRLKNCCINRNFPIIILIFTTSKRRFGGFTDIPFGNRKNTKNSFCFSFDEQKLYYNTNYVEWISDEGPKFDNGFSLGFGKNYKQLCFCYNDDFGLKEEEYYNYEAHRIYFE